VGHTMAAQPPFLLFKAISVRGGEQQYLENLLKFKDLLEMLEDTLRFSFSSRVLLTVLVLVYCMQLPEILRVEDFGNHARKVREGQAYRLVSAIFLHADVGHLLSNLMAIATLTPFVEDIFGPTMTLTMFVLAGLGGNILRNELGAKLKKMFRQLGLYHDKPHPVANFRRHEEITSIGASGSAWGLEGALFAALIREKAGSTVRLIVGLLTLLLNDVLHAVQRNEYNIDHAGHIFGCLSGFVFGWMALSFNHFFISSTRRGHLAVVAWRDCVGIACCVFMFYEILIKGKHKLAQEKGEKYSAAQEKRNLSLQAAQNDLAKSVKRLERKIEKLQRRIDAVEKGDT